MHTHIYSLALTTVLVMGAACDADPVTSPLLDHWVDEGRTRYRAVSTGPGRTCALTHDSAVRCWGQESPVAGFTMVSVGADYTCGLRPGGILECWGATMPDDPEELPDFDATYQDVSVGDGGGCAVRLDGAVTCWGQYPQPNPSLRLATVTARTPEQVCGLTVTGDLFCWPTALSPLQGLSQVSIGNRTAGCVQGGDLPAFCWHEGRTSQYAVHQVSVYGTTACGIRTDDRLLECWDLAGQSPLGSAPPPQGEFLSVSVSMDHGCAIDMNGKVVCWGDNTFGQSQVSCGDGVLQPGEACDDGNRRSLDGCSDRCRVDIGLML